MFLGLCSALGRRNGLSLTLSLSLPVTLQADATTIDLSTVLTAEGASLSGDQTGLTVTAAGFSGTATLASTGVLTITSAPPQWNFLLANTTYPLTLTGAQVTKDGRLQAARISFTLEGAANLQLAIGASQLAADGHTYNIGDTVTLTTATGPVDYTFTAPATVRVGNTGEKVLECPTADGWIMQATRKDGGTITARQVGATASYVINAGGINTTVTSDITGNETAFLRRGTAMTDGAAHGLIDLDTRLGDAEISLAGYTDGEVQDVVLFGCLRRVIETSLPTAGIGIVANVRVDATGGTHLVVSDAAPAQIIVASNLDEASLGALMGGLPAASQYGTWEPHNLLAHSNDFTQAAWLGTKPTTGQTEIAPDGSTVPIFSLASTGFIYQDAGSQIGARYVSGVWIKANMSAQLGLRATGVVFTDNTIINVSTAWQFFSSSRIADSTEGRFLIDARGASGLGATGLEVAIFGAHLYRDDLGGMQDVASPLFAGAEKYLPTGATPVAPVFDSTTYSPDLERRLTGQTAGVSFAFDLAEVFPSNADDPITNITTTGLTVSGGNATFSADGSQTVTLTATTSRGVVLQQSATVSVAPAVLTLGADEVTNGDFDTDISGWTPVNIGTTDTAGWAAGGYLRLPRVDGSNFSFAHQQIPSVDGQRRRLTVKSETGAVLVRVGDSALNSQRLNTSTVPSGQKSVFEYTSGNNSVVTLFAANNGTQPDVDFVQDQVIGATGSMAGISLTAGAPTPFDPADHYVLADGVTLGSAIVEVTGGAYSGGNITPNAAGPVTITITVTPVGADPVVISQALTAAAPASPTNSVAPAITGTLTEGQTLTISNGTWQNADTFTYQWTRDGVDIAGATNSSYLLALADVGTVIDCNVTGTGLGGSLTVSATGEGTVAAGQSAPALNVSASRSGQVITFTVNTLTGNPTPTLSLTTLTLAGVDVSADIVLVNSTTYTYTAPTGAQVSRNLVWQFTADNGVPDAATSGGTVIVPADVAATTTLLFGRNDGTDFIAEVSRSMAVYYLASNNATETVSTIVTANQTLSLGDNTPNLGNTSYLHMVAQDGSGTSDVVSLGNTPQFGPPPNILTDDFTGSLNGSYTFGQASGTLTTVLDNALAPSLTTGSTGALILDNPTSATTTSDGWMRFPISGGEATTVAIRSLWDNTTGGGTTAAGTIEVSQVNSGGTRVGAVLASATGFGGSDVAFDRDLSFTSEATAAFLEIRLVGARWDRMQYVLHDLIINQGAQSVLPTTINLSVNGALGTAQVLYDSDFTNPASVADFTVTSGTTTIQHSGTVNQGDLEWLGANTAGAIFFGDTTASGSNRVGKRFPSYEGQIVEAYGAVFSPNNIDGTPYTPAITRFRLNAIDGADNKTVIETINPVDVAGVIVSPPMPAGTVEFEVEVERAGPNASKIALQKIQVFDITTALPAVQNSGREYGLGPVPLNLGVQATIDMAHVFPGAEELIVTDSPANFTTDGTTITFTPQAVVTEASATQFTVRGRARGRDAFQATRPYIIVEDRPSLVISPVFEIVLQEGEFLNFTPWGMFDKDTGKWPLTIEFLTQPAWAVITNEGQKAVGFVPFSGEGVQTSLQFRVTEADGTQHTRTMPVRVKNFTTGTTGVTVVNPPAGTYAAPTDIREWLETNGLPGGNLPSGPLFIQCAAGYYKTGSWGNFFNLGANRVVINGAANYGTKFAAKNNIGDVCNVEIRNCEFVYEDTPFPVNSDSDLTSRYEPNFECGRPSSPTGWMILTNPRMRGYTQNDLSLETVVLPSGGWKYVNDGADNAILTPNFADTGPNQLYPNVPAGSRYGRAVYYGGIEIDGWVMMTGADIKRTCVPIRLGGPCNALIDTDIAELRVDVLKRNPHCYGLTILNLTTNHGGLDTWYGNSKLGPEHNDLDQVQANLGVHGDAITITGYFADAFGREIVNGRQMNVHSLGSFDINAHTRTYGRALMHRGNIYIASGNNAANLDTEQGIKQQVAFIPDPDTVGWITNEAVANSNHSDIEAIDVLANEGNEGLGNTRWPWTRTSIYQVSDFAPTDFFPNYANTGLSYNDPREAVDAGQPASAARFWADPAAPGNVAHPTLFAQWMKDGIRTYDLGVAA